MSQRFERPWGKVLIPGPPLGAQGPGDQLDPGLRLGAPPVPRSVPLHPSFSCLLTLSLTEMGAAPPSGRDLALVCWGDQLQLLQATWGRWVGTDCWWEVKGSAAVVASS